MRHLVTVIWVLLVLGAVVTGCEGARRYDSRLTAADSLMRSAPDSALMIVDAINRDSLTDEADRAYRDLLLTQARYRCYITATSDSDINRALAWYRAHPADREKLTRAYIYKGAVMEELGHPDSAMLYYKTAEATAAPDDYFNLGYSKMRIASLYQDQISQDSVAIIRLKQAIHYFDILNDTNYLISCFGDLGAICGVRYPDSTEYYLTHAIELAQQFNSIKQYTYKSKLAGFYYYSKENYHKANQLAMEIMRYGRDLCGEEQFYYYSALSYLKLGKIDSAKYILSITPPPSNPGDSMLRLDVITEIAKKENNNKILSDASIQSKALTTKYISNLSEKELVAAELDFEKQQIEAQNANHKTRVKNLIILLGIALFLLLAFAIFNYRMRQSLLIFNKEKESIRHEFELSLSKLQVQLDEANKNNRNVSQQVSDRLDALKELYQCLRVRINDDTKVKRIVPLNSLLKSMNDRHELLNANLSDRFWTKLKISVDNEYNGIGSYVEQNYPELSQKHLRLFYLYCANISPQIIILCLNMKSASNVSNYKNKLIREKMGLDMSFNEFIRLYQSGQINRSANKQ